LFAAAPGQMSGKASHARHGESPTGHGDTVSGVKRSFSEMFRAQEKEIVPTHMPQYVENQGPFKLGVPWKFATAIPAPGASGLKAAHERPLLHEDPGRMQTGATARVLHAVPNFTSVCNVLAQRGMVTNPPVSASSASTLLAARPSLAATETTRHMGPPASNTSHVVAPMVTAPCIEVSVTDPSIVSGATTAVASMQSLNANMIALETQSGPAVIKVNRVSSKNKKSANNALPRTP